MQMLPRLLLVDEVLRFILVLIFEAWSLLARTDLILCLWGLYLEQLRLLRLTYGWRTDVYCLWWDRSYRYFSVPRRGTILRKNCVRNWHNWDLFLPCWLIGLVLARKRIRLLSRVSSFKLYSLFLVVTLRLSRRHLNKVHTMILVNSLIGGLVYRSIFCVIVDGCLNKLFLTTNDLVFFRNSLANCNIVKCVLCQLCRLNAWLFILFNISSYF